MLLNQKKSNHSSPPPLTEKDKSSTDKDNNMPYTKPLPKRYKAGRKKNRN